MSQNVVMPYRYVPSVPYVKECWFVANINGVVTFTPTTEVNTVMTDQVISTSNPMYDWNSPNVRQVGMYLAAAPTLSAGLFRMGVWDSSGNIKVVSDQFTVADLVEGTAYSDTEEFLMPLSTTTSIADGDCVGIVMNELPTGTGNILGGGWYPAVLGGNWRRHIFIQGSTGDYATNKIIAVCLTT